MRCRRGFTIINGIRSRIPILAIAVLAAILIPFLLFEGPILSAFTSLTHSREAKPWLAIGFAFLLATDIVLPVPSSLVSTACGALVGFWPGLLASWLGMCSGCLLGYWLGRRFPAKRFLTPRDLQRLESLQHQFGDWMLLAVRAVPVLAEASVFFAGLSRRPLPRFLLVTTLSNLGISLAYVAAGAFAAERNAFLFAFLGAIGVPALAILWTRNRG